MIELNESTIPTYFRCIVEKTKELQNIRGRKIYVEEVKDNETAFVYKLTCNENIFYIKQMRGYNERLSRKKI